ncbi:SDR family NAD(P)-dependent oxidoreductase [Saccharothrix hoggarensis]|uniref:SDR family NAD(P)-dependent oxidoreductase n=1 Tax=Saccharothrix hoggarensis TaxID=913853 RepID=A0ABW3QQN3_9PSEU
MGTLAVGGGMVVDAPVAVVTGGNRGIGREVCRQLAERGHVVVLTARDAAKAAAEADRLGVDHHPLDVTDDASVEALAEYLAQEYGRVDALVNNAAIHYDSWQRASSADLRVVREAMETNFYGPWRTVLALLPLLRAARHARVVNVSSEAASLASMSGGTPAYGTSKAALNALTLTLAAELPGMRVNAVCPGWVATDMGGVGGRPVRHGAAGVVWAATLPADGPTGGFFRDGKRIPW